MFGMDSVIAMLKRIDAAARNPIGEVICSHELEVFYRAVQSDATRREASQAKPIRNEKIWRMRATSRENVCCWFPTNFEDLSRIRAFPWAFITLARVS